MREEAERRKLTFLVIKDFKGDETRFLMNNKKITPKKLVKKAIRNPKGNFKIKYIQERGVKTNELDLKTFLNNIEFGKSLPAGHPLGYDVPGFLGKIAYLWAEG